MMLSHCEMEIEKDDQKVSEGEPNLDQMSQQVQNLLKFKKFYDLVEFTASHGLAITKATIEFIDSSRGMVSINKAPNGGKI